MGAVTSGRTKAVLNGLLFVAACHAGVPRTPASPGGDDGLGATDAAAGVRPIRVVARRVVLPSSLGRRACSVEYPRVPSFVVLSEARLLFARAGLFELDLNRGEVVRSDVTHAPCQISADGKTIAASRVDGPADLGLSLDGGTAFVWTHPGNLVRCQESRTVATGAAMLVSCVGGIERWSGGSDPPTPIAAIAAKLFGSGARVVIGGPDAIRLSDDSGAHFSERTLSGIFSGGSVVALVGDSIYATGRSEDFAATFYVASWADPFHVVGAELPLSQASAFDSSGDVLTVSDESRIFVRMNARESFRQIEILSPGGAESVRPIGETHYAYGHLYVLSEAPSRETGGQPELAMYIAALPD